MKVRQHSIKLVFEDKEVTTIAKTTEVLEDLHAVMIDNNVNAVFDDEGLLLSRDNIEELIRIFDRLWNSPTVELCYSEHVKEMDENR